MDLKEKLIEKTLLVIALSSIAILALITFFIFEEGLPLIWKIGPALSFWGTDGFQARGNSASSP